MGKENTKVVRTGSYIIIITMMANNSSEKKSKTVRATTIYNSKAWASPIGDVCVADAIIIIIHHH